jgi:hypothetical protein
MTITKMQGRPREERNAFIIALLDRFLPKNPVPLSQRLTDLASPGESQRESKP